MVQTKAFLTELKALIGAPHLLQAAPEIAPFCLDARQRYLGQPLAIACPGTREEAARLVQLAARHHVPLVPQGGNTSTCGGATPDQSGQALVVAMHRLNRVIQVDSSNNSMTLEAGVTLAQAQAVAAGANRLFPLSLASEGSCQIGGNLSTNAGGLAVLRYGMMRDLTLGLEVVLPDGRVLQHLSCLRKDTSGLDLKQLFIGAEGQLGLITAASLKLFARPKAHATALIGVKDCQSAIDWLSALQAHFSDSLTTFEIMSESCMQLLQSYQSQPLPFSAPWTILLELSSMSSHEALQQQLIDCLATQDMMDGVVAQSEADRLGLWQLREDLSEAQRRRGPSIKHDIGVASHLLPRFLTETGQQLEQAFPGCCIMAFGHAGDGNLHYNISNTRADARDLFLDEPLVNQIVYDQVYQLNGTLAAEHGVGQLKTHWLERYKDPLELELMRQIKHLLDPMNLMNPGKWLSP